MKPKVYVTRPIGTEALDLLASRCDVAWNREDTRLGSEKLAEAIRDVEGLVLCGTALRAEVLEQAPRLRAVSVVGVGYDHVDLAACTARRIPVTNTVGVVAEATADFAFALLMAAARRVIEADRYVRDGRWQYWGWHLLWGANVHGKTLGLYGFGRIGQAMARRGRGFAMRILYHSRRRVSEAVEREVGAQPVDAETLLRQSDFVSLHVPLTPETEHLIGAAELALMKPSAFLINTARGRVVDEEALVAALEKRQVAGAALDVFEKEPHVHPALLAMPNVVLAPHIASGSEETRQRMARGAAQNLLDLLDGRRPRTLLNPEAITLPIDD